MLRIERAHSTRRVTWWTLLGLLLIPVLVGGGLLAAARPNTSAVSAAVVNLDEAVTIDGQIVPLGRQLAAAMVEQKENVSWTLADQSSAEEGLRAGEYAAAVIIPKGFSSAATSFANNVGEKAAQATIDVRVSQNSPVTDAAVAQQIARIASDVLSTTLTENYLDRIYIGFNTMGSQFVSVSDGARQLAEGGNRLNSGLGELATGSREFSSGMRQFADRMPQMVSGIKRLSSDGGNLLDGVGEFADGSTKVVGGVEQLGKGLREFERKVRQTKVDTSQLDQLRNGSRQLSNGIDKVSDGLKAMTVAELPRTGGKPMSCPVKDPQTCKIFDSVMASLQRLANGQIRIPPETFDKIACPVQDARQCAIFNEVVKLIKELSHRQGKLPQGIIERFKCPVTDQAACVLLLRTYLAGFQTGTGVAWAALNTPDPTSGVSLRSGAKQLAGGVDTLVKELPKQAATQQKQLADGIGQAATGAERISSGAAPLVKAAPKLKNGAAQFKAGLNQLASQSDKVSEGTKKLADGAIRLQEGTQAASEGAGKFADGMNQFAAKLEQGAKQVPRYSEGDRAALKKAVSRPINSDHSLMSPSLVAIAAVVFSAALWLGATACYVVMRPIPSRVLTSSRPTWQLTGRALLPGLSLAAIQAMGLSAIAGIVLGLSPAHTTALGAILLLAGVCFVIVNHAIAAWAGGLGQLIFFSLAVLAAAAGWTSGVPTWVSTLAGWSPVTPALHSLRGLWTGTSLTGPVGMLLAWLVIATAAGYLAVARRRLLSSAQFLRRR